MSVLLLDPSAPSVSCTPASSLDRMLVKQMRSPSSSELQKNDKIQLQSTSEFRHTPSSFSRDDGQQLLEIYGVRPRHDFRHGDLQLQAAKANEIKVFLAALLTWR